MRKGLMALLAANNGRGMFRAEAKDDAATVWLYDAIVSDDYWGGVSAITFAKELATLKDVATIHLRINSPGGDVFAARAMEQIMREHPARIVAHIDGYAASAASYVALAADEVLISQGGMYMIHKAWTIAFGNADDMKKSAALLDQVDESLVATYAAETGQDPEQLREWMAAETWFSADDAVKYGFADAIAGVVASNRAEWDLSAYSRAPAAAARPLPARNPPPPENTEPEFDVSAALRRLDLVARI